MREINCEVIEDLLPIYVENMASNSSNELVKKHLALCESCRQKEESMREEVELPPDMDVKVLKKISDKIYHKKVMAVAMTILMMLVISVIVIINLNAPIRLSYEEVSDYIHLTCDKENGVELWVDYPDSMVEVEYGTAENGANYAQISCYTTKWMQKFGGDYNKTRVVNLSEAEIGREFDTIYYSPSTSGEAVLIYQAPDSAESSGGGYIELPRFVLHYYILFAVMLTILGMIVCICLHKKKRAFYIALKITIIPVMYFLASILILSGKGDIYNAVYYFTGILLVTIILSLISCWVIEYVKHKKQERVN